MTMITYHFEVNTLAAMEAYPRTMIAYHFEVNTLAAMEAYLRTKIAYHFEVNTLAAIETYLRTKITCYFEVNTLAFSHPFRSQPSAFCDMTGFSQIPGRIPFFTKRTTNNILELNILAEIEFNSTLGQ